MSASAFPSGERRRNTRLLDAALLETVRETVMADAGPVTPSRVAAAVHATGRLLGTAGALAAVESISAELSGLGPLQQLARDASVTDIFVNGPDSVWFDRGKGLERAQVHFDGEPQIRALASRLVAAGGRRLDDSSPCVDVRLDGGYRVHAVLPPISTAGTLLSVRIRREEVFSMDELRAGGMFGAPVQQVLQAMVDRRLSFLISGATGSGKTTLLSTMLGLSSPHDRLVLIEDASELNPVHPHVVSLESRHGNLEGGGALDLGELVRQALRMRPDRLIVGECRGAEVRELLTALNTGHTGGGGTIHANTASAVPARLVALGALAGLSREAVQLQLSTALDAVVHVERTPAGRRVSCIGLLAEDASAQSIVPAVELRAGVAVAGPAWRDLAARLELDPGLLPGPLPGKPISRSQITLERSRERIPHSRPGGRCVGGLPTVPATWQTGSARSACVLPSAGAGCCRAAAGARMPRRRSRADALPLTVLVQQLAALLRGGRSTSRLWEELWMVHGARDHRIGSGDSEVRKARAKAPALPQAVVWVSPGSRGSAGGLDDRGRRSPKPSERRQRRIFRAGIRGTPNLGRTCRLPGRCGGEWLSVSRRADPIRRPA